MKQQNERKPRRRVQEGWMTVAINLRLGEHAELARQAEAAGISMHKLSKAALTAGLPLVIADLQSTGV